MVLIAVGPPARAATPLAPRAILGLVHAGDRLLRLTADQRDGALHRVVALAALLPLPVAAAVDADAAVVQQAAIVLLPRELALLAERGRHRALSHRDARSPVHAIRRDERVVRHLRHVEARHGAAQTALAKPALLRRGRGAHIDLQQPRAVRVTPRELLRCAKRDGDRFAHAAPERQLARQAASSLTMRVHRQSTEPAAATALQPLEQALQILQIDEPEAVRELLRRTIDDQLSASRAPSRVLRRPHECRSQTVRWTTRPLELSLAFLSAERCNGLQRLIISCWLQRLG